MFLYTSTAIEKKTRTVAPHYQCVRSVVCFQSLDDVPVGPGKVF